MAATDMAQIFIDNEFINESGTGESVGWQCTSTTWAQTSGGSCKVVDIWVSGSACTLDRQYPNKGGVSNQNIRCSWMFRSKLRITFVCKTTRMYSQKLSSSDIFPPKLPSISQFNREFFRKDLPLLAVRVDAPKAGVFLNAPVMKGYAVINLMDLYKITIKAFTSRTESKDSHPQSIQFARTIGSPRNCWWRCFTPLLDKSPLVTLY